MVCSQCQTPNFRDYKYCRECGLRLERGPESSSLPVPSDEVEIERLLEHAFAALDRGEADRALGSVQAALARDPESAAAHSVLGLVYERMGRIPDAIHQFKLVLSLNPSSTADREKLDQLLAHKYSEPADPRPMAPMRMAIACAVAAGVLTFGVGLALAKGGPKGSGARGTYEAASPLPISIPTANAAGRPAPVSSNAPRPVLPVHAAAPAQPFSTPFTGRLTPPARPA
jgi:tetratricopeptide (TPR) repeat protein